DLDERRAGESREPPCDLGLPHPSGADHDDVVRHDLLAEIVADTLAPPAVPQCDGDGLLRRFLPDDVLVELGDDLPWRQLVQPTLTVGGLRRCCVPGPDLRHDHSIRGRPRPPPGRYRAGRTAPKPLFQLEYRDIP